MNEVNEAVKWFSKEEAATNNYVEHRRWNPWKHRMAMEFQSKILNIALKSEITPVYG